MSRARFLFYLFSWASPSVSWRSLLSVIVTLIGAGANFVKRCMHPTSSLFNIAKVPMFIFLFAFSLLACFVAGNALNWDGHFLEETIQRHDEVNSCIDVLLNFGGFMYIGTIIPWSESHDPDGTGLTYPRLIALGFLVLVLRRIPAMGPTVYWLVFFSIVVHGLSIPALSILYHYMGVQPIQDANDVVEVRRASLQIPRPVNSVQMEDNVFLTYNSFRVPARSESLLMEEDRRLEGMHNIELTDSAQEREEEEREKRRRRRTIRYMF